MTGQGEQVVERGKRGAGRSEVRLEKLALSGLVERDVLRRVLGGVRVIFTRP